MWITKVQNDSTITIYANGVTIRAGTSVSSPYAPTGVAIAIPGVGQIQALDAGPDNPTPGSPAVKLVCGNWCSYWGYAGEATMTLRVFQTSAQFYFSVANGGPGQQAIQLASPDNVFPAPSICGEVNHDGVNAFTGDLNQSFPLGEIRDGRLSFGVSAFYNSRSAAVGTAAMDNVLGGHGWKLIDYPKIVQEGALLYLLDGMASYLLSLSPSGTGYVSGGDYHAWTFSASGNGASWTLTDDSGIQYQLSNRATLSSGRVVWHLAAITDSSWPTCVINLVYNNNAISSVGNSLGDMLSFNYDASGRLATVGRAATANPAQASAPLSQIVLGYAATAPQALVTLQSQAILPNGGSTPIDAGYLFQYYGANDPIYPQAMSTVQSPLGALMGYQYYAGNSIVSAGQSYTGLRPVVLVSNTSQPGVTVTKELFYSFWNWRFDATQTYVQWNLSKEYAGGVYASLDDDNPADPYGHTTYLFFTGQPASELIYYHGDAQAATDQAVRGRVYWTGNFEVVRTKMVSLGNDSAAVGPWPGTLVPLSLPPGALVRTVSCTASNNSNAQTDFVLDMETAGQQLQGSYQSLASQSSSPVNVELHILGPVTAVRAWSSTATSSAMSALAVTYILPPPTSLPPAGSNVAHLRQVVVSAYNALVPLAPGVDFSYTTPYTQATALVLSFFNQDGISSALTATCYDASGNLVGTGNFQAAANASAQGTVSLTAGASVARVNLTCTSAAGSTGIQSVFLNYMGVGEPVTDDALAWGISSAGNRFAIGRPGLASFAKRIESNSTVDGVVNSSSYTFGDDNSLPYPVTVAQTVVKPDQGGGGGAISISRQIEYAVQQYPALASNNMRAMVAQIIDSAAGSAAPAAVAGAVMQWRQWNGGAWDQWRQFTLQSSNVSNGFAPAPDGSWLASGSVTTRTSRGLVLTDVSADLVPSSRMFDTSFGNWEVAKFDNADVTLGQAAWYGFESYENAAGWTIQGGEIVSNRAYTGSASLAGSNLSIAPVRFAPRAGVNYLVAGFVRLDQNAQCVLGFQSAGVWASSQTIQFDPANPGWVYVQALMSSPAAQQLPTLTLTSGEIDHVVFAPLDAPFAATVWNLGRRQRIATVGPNGAVTRAFFDSTGQLLAAANPGQGVTLVDLPFSSVLGQTWFTGQAVYSAAQPNQSLAVRASGQAMWDSFTSTSNTCFPSATLVNLQRTGNHSMLATSATGPQSPGIALANAQLSTTDVIVYAEVLVGQTAGANGQAIGLTMRRSGGSDLLFGIGNGQIVLQDTSSGMTLNTTALVQTPPSIVLALLVRGGNTLYAYANGTLLFTQALPDSVGAPLGLRTSWPGSAFYNFGFVADPELSNASQDGSGLEQQFIASTSAASSSVSQSLYGGDLMLYSGQTLPTNLAQSNLAPVAGFATLNAQAMTVAGSITGHWPSAYSTQPFSDSIEHFNDPVLRPKSRGKAGKYTAGSSGAVSYAYGKDNDGYFGFPVNQLNTNLSSSPSGAAIITYSNRGGTLFGKARIDDSTHTSLLTGYEYDLALRQSAVYFPAAYANSTTVNKNIFYRKFSYDFTGELIQVNDADTGLVSYAYDDARRQRLSQDAIGLAASPPYCIYTRYDLLGRVIETGRWNGVLSQATRSQLNDQSWPSQGMSWLRKINWDLPNMQELNSVGKMTGASTPELSQWYQYNSAGLPTQIITSAPFLIAQLSMSYDAFGRVLSVNEPNSSYSVNYAYDEQGRLLSVGSDTDPVAYASYAYDNGTVTEVLLKGVATRTYSLNALGDLQSIVDDYFSEVLYFDTRHNGTPGYMNGQVASASYSFNWAGAPKAYVFENTYDNFGRLTSAINPAYPELGIGTASAPVCYDNNGNIVSMNRGGNSLNFSYSPNTNLLNNVGGGPSFSYDVAGNVTSVTQAGNTSLTYTALGNQVLTATTPSSTVSFTYDVSGRHVQRVSGANTLTYLRDKDGRVLNETLDTDQGISSVNYIYGLRGRIAMLPQDGKGTAYALLCDHANSVRVMVNAQRNVVSWYNYDPYGGLDASTSHPGSAGLRYLYTGQEWDFDLNLYNFSARLYDPAICRFYSPDPLRQFSSPYIYSDNPWSFEDPTGEWMGFDDLLAIVGGALVGGGLELAREAVAGESWNWKSIATATAIGALVGEAALYTAGGAGASTILAGGGSTAALKGAGTTVGMGMIYGAPIGAATGMASGALRHYTDDTGRSVGADILWGALAGAVNGAQTSMVTSVMAPALGAIMLGKPLAGSLINPVVEIALRSRTRGAISGALTGGANSIIGSLVQGRSFGKAVVHLGESAIIGGVLGATWNLKNAARMSLGFRGAPAHGPDAEIELATLVA